MKKSTVTSRKGSAKLLEHLFNPEPRAVNSLSQQHDTSSIYKVASGYIKWLSGFQESHHQTHELICDPLRIEWLSIMTNYLS